MNTITVVLTILAVVNYFAHLAIVKYGLEHKELPEAKAKFLFQNMGLSAVSAVLFAVYSWFDRGVAPVVISEIFLVLTFFVMNQINAKKN